MTKNKKAFVGLSSREISIGAFKKYLQVYSKGPFEKIIFSDLTNGEVILVIKNNKKKPDLIEVMKGY